MYVDLPSRRLLVKHLQFHSAAFNGVLMTAPEQNKSRQAAAAFDLFLYMKRGSRLRLTEWDFRLEYILTFVARLCRPLFLRAPPSQHLIWLCLCSHL